MKKTLTLLSFAILGGFALTQQSCTKDLIAHLFNTFNTKPQEVRFRIPIIPTAGEDFAILDTVQSRVDIQGELDLQSNGAYTIDDVESITINSIRLALDSPELVNNWANFSDIELSIYGANIGGLTEVIGSKRGIPDEYATELTLDPSGESVNVRNYLSSGDVLYRISGINRRYTTKIQYATAYVTYTVHPN